MKPQNYQEAVRDAQVRAVFMKRLIEKEKIVFNNSPGTPFFETDYRLGKMVKSYTCFAFKEKTAQGEMFLAFKPDLTDSNPSLKICAFYEDQNGNRHVLFFDKRGPLEKKDFEGRKTYIQEGMLICGKHYYKNMLVNLSGRVTLIFSEGQAEVRFHKWPVFDKLVNGHYIYSRKRLGRGLDQEWPVTVKDLESDNDLSVPSLSGNVDAVAEKTVDEALGNIEDSGCW